MELCQGRAGGGEGKAVPQRVVGMAQLPGQQAQPRAAGAQGVLGHHSDTRSGWCCVIPVGPFQLGTFYVLW